VDPAHEITLIESEAVEAVNRNLGRKLGTQFAPADFRRNVATPGVALNHLIDQEFFVGGLRAQILTAGRIRVGDSIRTAAPASSSNKELIRRYYEEMWNPWNFDAADDLLAENISFRGSLGVETKGREAFREYMRQERRAFPDFHNTIDESIEDGDSIAARLTYRGTHRGEIFGVAPVLVQPEMERGRSPLVSIPPFGAGIFKASRSTDPMRIWKQRKGQVPALPFIVSMSPPGYPSAWLRPRRARFRFARQDHCSFTTSIRLNFDGP
jgi:predicted ester cyclase